MDDISLALRKIGYCQNSATPSLTSSGQWGSKVYMTQNIADQAARDAGHGNFTKKGLWTRRYRWTAYVHASRHPEPLSAS